MKTISLKLPERLARRLDETAKEHKKSRSEYFREALEEKLAAEIEERKETFLDLTSDLCGSAESGVGDLSTNPDHMDGFGR